MAVAAQCGCGKHECLECRFRALGQARRKYVWSDELRQALVKAYCGRKPQLSAALDKLEARTRWPRHAFKSEALRMGLVTGDSRRKWSAEDERVLRESVGVVAVSTIARRLKRSVLAVESRAERLRLSRRIREGYTVADLRACFGETEQRVRGWLRRGLLGFVHTGGRIAEANVVRFLRKHPHEYDLRRIDQHWYKGMLFGTGAEMGPKV